MSSPPLQEVDVSTPRTPPLSRICEEVLRSPPTLRFSPEQQQTGDRAAPSLPSVENQSLFEPPPRPQSLVCEETVSSVDESDNSNDILGKRVRPEDEDESDSSSSEEEEEEEESEEDLAKKNLKAFTQNNRAMLTVEANQLHISSTRDKEIQCEHPHQSLALMKKELIDYAGNLFYLMKCQEVQIEKEKERPPTACTMNYQRKSVLAAHKAELRGKTKDILICIHLIEQIETEGRGRLCSIKMVPKLFSPFSSMESMMTINRLPPFVGCLLVREVQDGRCAQTYTTYDGAQAMDRLQYGVAASSTFANAGFSFTAGNQNLTVNISELGSKFDKSRVAATVLETPFTRYKIERLEEMIHRAKNDMPDGLYLATMSRISNLLKHMRTKNLITFKVVVQARRPVSEFSPEEQNLASDVRHISRREDHLGELVVHNETEMFKHMHQDFATQDFDEPYAYQTTSYVISTYMGKALDDDPLEMKSLFLGGWYRQKDVDNMNSFCIYRANIDSSVVDVNIHLLSVDNLQREHPSRVQATDLPQDTSEFICNESSTFTLAQEGMPLVGPNVQQHMPHILQSAGFVNLPGSMNALHSQLLPHAHEAHAYTANQIPYLDKRFALAAPPPYTGVTGTERTAHENWQKDVRNLFTDVANDYTQNLHRDLPLDKDLIDRVRTQYKPVSEMQMRFNNTWQFGGQRKGVTFSGPTVRRTME